MANEISKKIRNELIHTIRIRYKDATKMEKTRILDEFVALSGYHRKHACRLLSRQNEHYEANKTIKSQRIYNEAVKQALIILWETADRICSKRLKAVIPDLMESMERHQHMNLDPTVRERLLKISASSIDRLLYDVREKAKPHRKKRRSPKKVSRLVPIRTFADWDDPEPGYLEVDFVAHNGGSSSGVFIHTLVGTDINSGWTECIPLLAREQSLVVEGLEAFCHRFPFPVLGLDFDNDGAFINDTLFNYCETHAIKFTRSRPFHKNDQAWVEQKNSAVVRRFVGYERFSGFIAGQALAQLYQHVRLYVNYFQPSFKLQKKIRLGARTKRIYDKPSTPHNRLIDHSTIQESEKNFLRSESVQLDPVHLLHQIRDKQAALSALSTPEYQATGPGRKSLDEFLSQLPTIWRYGDARPTHCRKPVKVRYWRTREDPFKEVWTDVLLWLQTDPDTTAKDLFERLQNEYPKKFFDGQLRTLQRRVKEWRQIMAKELVYSCLDQGPSYDNIAPIGLKLNEWK